MDANHFLPKYAPGIDLRPGAKGWNGGGKKAKLTGRIRVRFAAITKPPGSPPNSESPR